MSLEKYVAKCDITKKSEPKVIGTKKPAAT